MPAKKGKPAQNIYQLKVTLRDSQPPIWRRVQVPGNISLAHLCDVLLDVMGWEGYHLHQFTIRGVDYGPADPDSWGNDMEDERKAKLSQVVPHVRTKFSYLYDFGDSWEHVLTVEKIQPPEPGVRYPVCLDGAGNCPPEDCGGIWGYQELLQALQDPKNPEHAELLDWVGGEFDPEAFSVEEVNKKLAPLQRK